MSVIVTNAKNRIAYGIVKSLGQKGIRVFTSDFASLSMAFASRYSQAHFLYPSPFKEQESFIDCLIKHVHRLNADVLIPVFEETFLLSKFKQEVSKHVRIVLPDYQQILVAHNKDKWLPIAKKMKIPVPESFSIEDLRSNVEKIRQLRFPVLIKPKQGGGAWGIVQLDSLGELEMLLENKSHVGLPWERFFVQEMLRGQVHCVAMLFNKGQIRGHVVYKQLRDYPVSGGQATLRVSVHHPEVVEHLKKLLEKLNWHGMCQADFLVEQHTGIPYLIDLNPRFWGSLIQGIASGVDFPFLVYKMAVDGDVEPSNGFKTGVKTRWIWGDIRTLPETFKASEDKLKFIREFMSDFNKNVLYDDFSLDDPLPFMTFGLDSVVKMIRHGTFSPTTHDSLEGTWE